MTDPSLIGTATVFEEEVTDELIPLLIGLILLAIVPGAHCLFTYTLSHDYDFTYVVLY